MEILVDSSVWIDYFRDGEKSDLIDYYIDQNIICTNDLILAELIPVLKIKKQIKLIKLMNEISKIPLKINWEKVIDYQTICLKNGINNVGIPDLLIVDNVVTNNLILFSMDKHFKLIGNYIDLKIV